MGANAVLEYIASAPAGARPALEKLRAAILASSPGVTERISYEIPTFDVDGRRCLYIAGYEHHVSVYPVTAAMEATHGAALAPYRSGKGTLRFPLDAPLPLPLLRKVVRTRIAECRAEAPVPVKARPATRGTTKRRKPSR